MPVPACAHVGLPSSGPVEHGESQALADSPARSALVHSLMQAIVRMSPLLAAAANTPRPFASATPSGRGKGLAMRPREHGPPPAREQHERLQRQHQQW